MENSSHPKSQESQASQEYVNQNQTNLSRTDAVIDDSTMQSPGQAQHPPFHVNYGGTGQQQYESTTTNHLHAQGPHLYPQDSSSSHFRQQSFGGSGGGESSRAPLPWTRFAIPTKNNSLSSGFPFHPRLYELKVTHDEWNLYTTALVAAAKMTFGEDALAWTTGITAGTLSSPVLLILAPVLGYYSGRAVHRKALVKTVKDRLGQDGELRDALVRWNEIWKAKGFQAWLEVPRDSGELLDEIGIESSTLAGKSPEAVKKVQRKAAKRFRIIIMPADDDATAWEAPLSFDSGSIGSSSGNHQVPESVSDDGQSTRGAAGNRMTLPPSYAESSTDGPPAPVPRMPIREKGGEEFERDVQNAPPSQIRYSRPDGFTNT